MPKPPKSKLLPAPTKKLQMRLPLSKDEGDLQTLDDKGKAPRNRFKNAAALLSDYNRQVLADVRSAANRATLQANLDGAPPMNQSEQNRTGMGFQYNINSLETRVHFDAALTAYDDLNTATHELIVPDFYPGKLSDEDQAEVSDVVAEEHARLLREHPSFYTNSQILAKEFVGHGVGFTFFPDEETPWWEAGGWNEFKMPRKTKIGEKYLTRLYGRHSYPVDQLFAKIEEGEHYSTDWNYEETAKAITLAARSPKKSENWHRYWDDLVIELKNNDLGEASNAEMVDCIHAWVKEFDGSYSFYVTLENGSNEDYLCEAKNLYPVGSHPFTVYTLGVGNGTYHSVRGMLWMMHPTGQAINRMLSRQLTQTDLAMSLAMQPVDAESLDDMAITLAGPIAYLPPESAAKIVERRIPDVSTQGMPVLQSLRETMRKSVGQYQSRSAAPDISGDITRYQIQAEQTEGNTLTANSVNRFDQCRDKTIHEQFKRIQALPPDTAKYPEVREFYDRCKERLEPLGIDAVEVIKKFIRRVTATRTIGNGSPQMRQVALDRLSQRMGSLDETGRNLLTRDAIALDSNRQAADRYCPKAKRTVPDFKLAILENAAMHTDEVPVTPGENHPVHASVHIPVFIQIVQQIVSMREQNPEADFRPLRPQLEYAVRLHAHSEGHVEGMAADPSRDQDRKSFAAALEQGSNLISAFARQVAAQERQGQIDSASGNGEPAQVNDQQQAQQDLVFKAERHQLELKNAQETHALDMQLKSTQIAAAAQDMRLKEVETGAKVAQQVAKTKASASKAT